VTRLAVIAQLVQAAALALALGVLIAPAPTAPAPERVPTHRPATAAEQQRADADYLRWAMTQPQP
jgi:hypothetical protein